MKRGERETEGMKRGRNITNEFSNSASIRIDKEWQNQARRFLRPKTVFFKFNNIKNIAVVIQEKMIIMDVY